MRNLFFILTLLCSVFVSCSDDDNTLDETTPITGLVLPQSSKENALSPNQEITITGKGFTEKSEIWFEAISGNNTNEKLKAEIKTITEQGITFVTPLVYLEQNVILKLDGKEYILGQMYFKEKPMRFYAFCNNRDINELAEIDINTGKLTWSGYKIPEAEYIEVSRSLISKELNEFVGLDFTKPSYSKRILRRVNLDTKKLTSIELEAGFYLVQHKGKIYTQKDNGLEGADELVEINLNTGQLISTGYKLKEKVIMFLGHIFDDKRNELINLYSYHVDNDYSKDLVYSIDRINLTTKEIKTVNVKNPSKLGYFDQMVMYDNRFFAFCKDNNVNELFEFDIETGNIIPTGIKCPNYPYINRGYLFSKETNEFLIFGATMNEAEHYLIKIDITTKKITTLKIEDERAPSRFDIIMARDF